MIGDDETREGHITAHLAQAEVNIDKAYEQAGGAFGGPTTCLLAAIAHDLHALALMLGIEDESEPPTQEREEP